MSDLDGDRPEEYHPTGGMRSATGVMCQTSISRPGMSGYVVLGIGGAIGGAVAVGIYLLWRFRRQPAPSAGPPPNPDPTQKDPP